MLVRSLGQEDPLEEGMKTHSSILSPGESSWAEEPGRLQSMGSQSQTQLKQLSMQHTQAGPGCHFLLQGIFLTQRSNPRLLHLRHCQEDSLPLAPSGKPLFSKHNLPKFICNVLK